MKIFDQTNNKEIYFPVELLEKLENFIKLGYINEEEIENEILYETETDALIKLNNLINRKESYYKRNFVYQDPNKLFEPRK